MEERKMGKKVEVSFHFSWFIFTVGSVVSNMISHVS